MLLIIQKLLVTGAFLVGAQQVAAEGDTRSARGGLEECFERNTLVASAEWAPEEPEDLCWLFCERNFSAARLQGRSLRPSGLCCCRLSQRPEVAGQLERPPANAPRSAGGGVYGEQFAASEELEQPAAMSLGRPATGPGVDLVAFNRRRFELDHRHEGSSSAENELRRSELIETKLATIPERLLSNLPPEVNKQIFESLSTDPSLMVGPATMLLPDGSTRQDPDGASVERLTKSCLTVHASSSKPEQLNVTFHLYTRANPQAPFIIRPQTSRLELLRGSPLRADRPIKWITHGFHTNVDKSEWMVEAKDKILAFEDANVILTDWRRGASPTLAFYPKAAANAHVVAKLIVKILRRLKADIELSRVHLIGHSLGAHIMGFVGSAFTEEFLHQQQQVLAQRSAQAQAAGQPQAEFWRELPPAAVAASQLIGRITACDPALPCFGPTSSSPASQPTIPPTSTQPSIDGRAGSGSGPAADWTPTMWTHLRPDSAVLVEVMHSNPGVMGYSEPLGDFDFFPNGFEKQPGCGEQQHPERTKRQLSGLVSNFLGSGGDRAQPISQTLDRFIKPIRDFFHGYTCSHHRSVEYMVESLYYERTPQDRKLDRDFVCQMVGYRCADYRSFKRGFCFKCGSEHDCRAFTMPGGAASQSSDFREPPRANNLSKRSAEGGLGEHALEKFKPLLRALAADESAESRALERPGNSTSAKTLAKRLLPTFNHFSQHYLPARRNQYYFDTKPLKDFCLHHYHLLIKYRWFRVRESVAVEGLQLVGTLANITLASAPDASRPQQPAANILLNKHTYQTYTMLLTEPVFLGQIEALVIVGDRLRSALVEYAELTYMSNLDPRVRALGSARLCRAPAPPVTQNPNFQIPSGGSRAQQSVFVRCSGFMV